MALYAIGDLHLSLSTNKPMEKFGQIWEGHIKKIEENCRAVIQPEDTLVILGDHSWGIYLKNCMQDLEFIASLPGRKILLRGNHDLFWKTSKTSMLNELFSGRLEFLQNNFYSYKEYALVGSKGCLREKEMDEEHYLKLLNREIGRLEMSFEKAIQSGYQKFIMLLHYPPTKPDESDSPFTKLAEKYHVT